ncbi:hypothetical protein CAPTEDRAFT_218916 [Capitella teleta]|uniref:Uncharacterized protein n=1 Tax=Capitella teleta TaxID=283909 RepID=R7TXX4_CAPTE|nr:hypothetical protein CAPTEDRAFT_218916 [Capitella teleta]|eukprot:ELT96281.1 hypothetical protein CAPTEDRAFT_218916 [Capitella teleta]
MDMREYFVNQGRDDFWTEVQKMRGNNSATPTIVDDCLSEDDIALCFREKYNTLYNSVGYVPEEMARLRQEIEANACRHEGEMCPSHVLSVRDVTIALEMAARTGLITEEVACTSAQCSWKELSRKKVVPKKLKHINFSRPKKSHIRTPMKRQKAREHVGNISSTDIAALQTAAPTAAFFSSISIDQDSDTDTASEGESDVPSPLSTLYDPSAKDLSLRRSVCSLCPLSVWLAVHSFKMLSSSWRCTAGLFLHVLAIACFVYSVSTPWWVAGELRGSRVHLGLWSVCRNDFCLSVFDEGSVVLDILGSGWMNAVQILTCAGLGLIGVSLLLLMTYLKCCRLHDQHGPLQMAVFFLFLSSLSFVICEIVYWAETNNKIQFEFPKFSLHQRNSFGQPSDLQYSSSFYVLIGGILSSTLGGIYYTLEYRQLTNIRIHYVPIA